MSPLEALQSVMYETYADESGETVSMSLLPPITPAESRNFSQSSVTGYLPSALRDLISFAGGIIVPEFGEINFTRKTSDHAALLFPTGVELMNDGLGNAWILDVNAIPDGGRVYYLSRHPGVLMLQATDLASFILLIDEFNREGAASAIHTAYETTVWQIWNDVKPLLNEEFRAIDDDASVNEFFNNHRDKIIIDMRVAKPGQGYALGRFDDMEKIIRRCGILPLWAIEKKQKPGFFRKLFRW